MITIHVRYASRDEVIAAGVSAEQADTLIYPCYGMIFSPLAGASPKDMAEAFAVHLKAAVDSLEALKRGLSAPKLPPLLSIPPGENADAIAAIERINARRMKLRESMQSGEVTP